MSKTVKINVPPAIWQEVLRIAENHNIQPVNVIRAFFELGLVAEAIQQQGEDTGLFVRETPMGELVPLQLFKPIADENETPQWPEWLDGIDLFGDEDETGS